MAGRYVMTPARRAALKKAQLASARKRRGTGKAKKTVKQRVAAKTYGKYVHTNPDGSTQKRKGHKGFRHELKKTLKNKKSRNAILKGSAKVAGHVGAHYIAKRYGGPQYALAFSLADLAHSTYKSRQAFKPKPRKSLGQRLDNNTARRRAFMQAAANTPPPRKKKKRR